MVYPLVVELKHSWNFPRRHLWDERPVTAIVPSRLTQAQQFKHNSCQIGSHFASHCDTAPRDPKMAQPMFEAHFQTFEEPESGVALTARLSAFREELARRKLTGFVVPRADQQQNEYVAPSEERLAWLTGFTGSAGHGDRADAGGRGIRRRPLYAAGRQTGRRARPGASSRWSIRRRKAGWRQHLKAGDRLGFDPWLHTSAAAERLAAACAKAGAELVAVDSNPLDSVWTERPAPPLGPVAIHGTQFSGEAEADKLRRIRPRSPSSASMRWCCRIRTRWPGPSTSAAPTSRIRRCRCPTRWCRRTAARPCSSITASSPTARATISSRSADVAEPDALTPTLTALAQARRVDRARQRHRGRRAEPADLGRRRQAGARQRSGQPAQGRQEPHRDRGHPHARTGATRWRWRGSSPGSTAKRPRAR